MVNSTNDSLQHWNSINWKIVNKEVQKFRFKNWKYTRLGKFNKLRNSQKLLTHSTANMLYSIRKVTQINTGSKTPGFDEQLYHTPRTKIEFVFRIKRFKIM